MKKRSIGIIIGLMSFALLGVVAMQLYFLRESYKLQSQLFDHDVKEALNVVADKLTRQDALDFINKKAQSQNLHGDKKGNTVVEPADKNDQVFINDSAKSRNKFNLHDRQVALLRDSLQRIILHQKLDDELAESYLQVRVDQFTDDFGVLQTRLTPTIKRDPRIRRKPHKYDTIRYIYSDPLYGNQVTTSVHLDPQWKAQHDRVKEQQKIEQVLHQDSLKNLASSTVIQSLSEEIQKSGEPLKSRINPALIDSLLRAELINRGITTDYSYEVTTANTDSVIFIKALNANSGQAIFLPADSYKSPIFARELLNDPGSLKIFFPKKNAAILSTMTASMGTTAGLLFVLIFCFGYILFAIIRQKKIAEMKADFINNMTHEFKTPVSTIMIASDALRDNEIVEDKSRISRLANIIYEENARLGSHIERVLNIARIDNNDFKLEKNPVDINEMVAVVVDSMELKLQKSNAVINLNLDAQNAIIKADELHFSNLLYNLVDNAIKYSKDRPEITISTLNKNGHVIIRVSDKGIGMSRDQQTKIFEQFYRIPTGNLHDVKGFGLGLSYVNTIVKRLNGTIGVRSEKDKGSEFELKFSVA